MKAREAIYLLAALIAWSVPCLTSRLNERDRQETARFQISVWQENGHALQRTQDSLDAARKLLERQEGETKPSVHL